MGGTWLSKPEVVPEWENRLLEAAGRDRGSLMSSVIHVSDAKMARIVSSLDEESLQQFVQHRLGNWKKEAAADEAPAELKARVALKPFPLLEIERSTAQVILAGAASGLFWSSWKHFRTHFALSKYQALVRVNPEKAEELKNDFAEIPKRKFLNAAREAQKAGRRSALSFTISFTIPLVYWAYYGRADQ